MDATLPLEFGRGRFRPLERVGSGATASVWRCADRRDGTVCAVKALHASHLLRPSARIRFSLEADAMRRIRHRYVVPVVACGTEEAQPWIAMEFEPGGSLAAWVRRGPTAPRKAAEATIQVCKGIAAAHAVGVVHRDVKPGNVLVSQQGVCKVTDFGIAQVGQHAGLTGPGATMGTRGYLAPEQIVDARRADERSDVYGIGALLYALLRGCTPAQLYAAEWDAGVLDGLPVPLARVIAAATRLAPEDRVQSASELARRVHDAVAELPEPPRR